MALAILKELLGDAYTEQLDTKISEAVGKGFVARSDFNELKEAKKSLEAQLAEANTAIEGFRAADKDIEAVRKEAEEYRARAAQIEKDAAAQLEAYKFDNWLDSYIAQRKGRNAAVIRTLVGEEQLEKLRASKNRDEDAKALFDALEKEHAYAFEDKTPPPPPYAAGAAQQIMTDPSAAYRAAAGLKTEK